MAPPEAWKRPGRGVLGNGWTYVGVWCVTHLLMVWAWLAMSPWMVGDVTYFWWRMEEMAGGRPIREVLTEYPTPVVWGMWLLHLVGGTSTAYLWAFALTMAALDAALGVLLWHRSGPNRLMATLFWLAFAPAIGPIILFRFDVLPAFLTGAALICTTRRPRVAGALVALGAAIKLWPALLVLPLLARARRRGAMATAFGVVGGGLALASLLVGGWSRLVSPLVWQSERGLQVESLPATPLMLARTLLPNDTYVVKLSGFHAYEITGPGVAVALTVSSVLTVAGLVVIGLLGARLWLAAAPRADAVGLVVLSIIAIMILTNKTLSPQYLIWLGGPLAVLLGKRTPVGGTRDRRDSLLIAVLGLACLTQLIYPLGYAGIISDRGSTIVASLLVLRNALLVFVACLVSWWAWDAAGPARREARPAADESR